MVAGAARTPARVYAADSHRRVRRVPGEGLRCGLCGELPALGSLWRWVYANAYSKLNPEVGAPGGNFFVCASCDPKQDNKAALAKRRELYEQLNKLHRCFTWSEHCPRPEDYR